MALPKEFPHWGYPPDGGPAKIIESPDDWPDGWLDGPVEGGPQTGQRVIGQPTEFTPPTNTDPTHIAPIVEMPKRKPKSKEE